MGIEGLQPPGFTWMNPYTDKRSADLRWAGPTGPGPATYPTDTVIPRDYSRSSRVVSRGDRKYTLGTQGYQGKHIIIIIIIIIR